MIGARNRDLSKRKALRKRRIAREIYTDTHNSEIFEYYDSKELLDICPILYHEDMKALGLKNLMKCYSEWIASCEAEEEAEETNE